MLAKWDMIVSAPVNLPICLTKQWSSLGAKHKNATERWQHTRDVLDGSHGHSLQCRKIRLCGYHVASQLKKNGFFNLCWMCKWDNMGPSVLNTVEDLRNIQLSLWEVSANGCACSRSQGWFKNKCVCVCVSISVFPFACSQRAPMF